MYSRFLSTITLCRSFVDSLFLVDVTTTSEIYILSLHDALPICTNCLYRSKLKIKEVFRCRYQRGSLLIACWRDRKSTRLNSSHLGISYAVFCLKKKKKRS